jgi:hypothetical protein
MDKLELEYLDVELDGGLSKLTDKINEIVSKKANEEQSKFMQNEEKEWKEEFDVKFVDKMRPTGGDGNAWPGEEGIEYIDIIKDELSPTEVKQFIQSLLSQKDKEWREKIEQSFYEVEELEKDFDLNQKIIKIRNALLKPTK